MSAPTKFRLALEGKQHLLGTEAERALLGLYFQAGGFDKETADASVFRWSRAIDKAEFAAKLQQATKWAETVTISPEGK